MRDSVAVGRACQLMVNNWPNSRPDKVSGRGLQILHIWLLFEPRLQLGLCTQNEAQKLSRDEYTSFTRRKTPFYTHRVYGRMQTIFRAGLSLIVVLSLIYILSCPSNHVSYLFQWTFEALVFLLTATERFLSQPLVCGTVFHRTSLLPPYSIFCCCLKSHLFSLSYLAFSSLIYTVPAQWIVILVYFLDNIIAI